MELDTLRAHNRELEKAQRKVPIPSFPSSSASLRGLLGLQVDQMMNEERTVLAKLEAERDAAAQESRERETKCLSLQAELEERDDALEELRREKGRLGLELDDLMSSKDDVGRSVHDLEKLKRELESKNEEQRLLIEELEDSNQLAEDAKLRADVNLQAARAEIDRLKSEAESEGDEKRRALAKQIRDLEEELGSERRQKTAATNQRKKMEAQLADLEAALELSNRLKEDYNRQLKKLGAQVKDYQHDAEEARQSREETAAAYRDMEKRLRSNEAELASLQVPLPFLFLPPSSSSPSSGLRSNWTR